jgi:glucose/arabinose dehydrogenase
MTSKTVLVSAVLALVAAGADARAQQVPLKDPIPQPIPQSRIQVTLKPVATGLTSPISLTVSDPGEEDQREGNEHDKGRRNDGHGDGDDERRIDRKFIVDQTGLVLLMKRGVIQPTPFLDITGVISQLSPAFGFGAPGLNPGYDERGLLGLAFHPGFRDRGSRGYHTLYTLHNVPVVRPADFPQPPFPPGAVPNCQEVIAEWHVSRQNADEVDPASYREVLRYDKPQFNHNGGTVAFGPDGLLYAAFGDGGAANDVGPGHTPVTGNAQVLNTILGKVIRINPLAPWLTSHHDGEVSANGQYRIPRNNPFVNRAGALGEIYAYGLRNPYRFSFDAKGGQLVLGDVGQDNIEEVDIIRSGGNYGWHKKEGTFLFDPATGDVFTDPNPDPNLINPVVEYDHFEATVKMETRVAIVGGFVYRGSEIPELRGKYICADLNGFLFDADLKTGRLEQLLDTGMFIKGFGQDADDELYVLGSTNIGPSGENGAVLRIRSARRDDGD